MNKESVVNIVPGHSCLCGTIRACNETSRLQQVVHTERYTKVRTQSLQKCHRYANPLGLHVLERTETVMWQVLQTPATYYLRCITYRWFRKVEKGRCVV